MEAFEILSNHPTTLGVTEKEMPQLSRLSLRGISKQCMEGIHEQFLKGPPETEAYCDFKAHFKYLEMNSRRGDGAAPGRK